MIHTNKEFMADYIKIYGNNYVLDVLPYKHRDANVMGLPLLMKLGLFMREINGIKQFSFLTMPVDYFTAENIV